MICTLDANALVVWAAQESGDLDVARLDALFVEISRSKGRLILPTPVLAEFFVRSSATGASAWLAALQRKQAIKVAEFDVKAAAECAAIHRRAVDAGSKRHHVKPNEAYQKIKVDRQIAAIAIVNRSDAVITADGNLRTVCEANGLRVMSVQDLAIPDAARQRRIEEVPDESDATGDVIQPAPPH
ncbi:hypothetical protein PLCT2_03006 [Planctomycetaceae bacterium]|nr:hypothetical protein PLCT2_03006 [Planctomycetaceae bacterium]